MKCYAAYAKDINIRNLGSSGGIYPVISTEYINNGGIVYASVYDDDLKVLFKRIDKLDDLSATFTSKYMQSDSTNIYNKVKEDLKLENKVLFCGTPCQVKALYKYLSVSNVSMDNLLLIDIICHGVPSQKVFQVYMKEYTDKRITSLNMRNKEFGWDWYNYSWKMFFDDGTSKIENQNKVPFMKGFSSNIFLRPSCYYCMSKKNKYSDITLGDFWGVSNTNLKLDSKYGVSCVLLNSDKGEKEFKTVEYLLNIFETTFKDILTGNPSLVESSRKPYRRNLFFKRLGKCDSIESLADKLNKKTYFTRVMNKVYEKLISAKTSTKDLSTDGTVKFMYDNKEGCSGCMACYSICPKKAIILEYDNEGFKYPVVDQEKCVKCGLCDKVCPQKNK